MKIDKHAIVELLRERGHHEHADRAERELPAEVDDEQHSGLLQQYGVPTEELVRRFGDSFGRAG